MSDINWTAIRADYEAGASLRALAGKYGVSKSVIGERKFKEQWDTHKDKRTPVSSQRLSNPPTRDASAAQRVALALGLRARKLTYGEIAKQCGYNSADTCRKAIQRELQRVVVASVEELRREELYLLDTLHASLYDRATNPNAEYQTFAADRIIAISKRRSELMGLDVRPDEQLMQQNYIKKIILMPASSAPEGAPDASSNG